MNGADTVIPFSGGGTPELVWRHPSGDSATSFSAQTIRVDTTKYNCFIIKTRTWNYSNNYHFDVITSKNSGNGYIGYQESQGMRKAQIVSSGITITNPMQNAYSSAGTATEYIIPTKIWGLMIDLTNVT